jgi:geranylgeranyl diphosphate synthase type I
MNIDVFRKRFDALLVRFLNKKTLGLKTCTSDASARSIIAYAKKLAMGGGKRIRPYLAYIAHRAAGGSSDRGMDALVGLELFHVFALVHDDIMDRGQTRHGVPTANRIFGDAQAILLGDLLFNWSAEIVATTKGQPVFMKMVDEVIIGQMLDVDAPNRSRVSDRFVLEKMRLKTASYTFIRPMQFGVALVPTTPSPSSGMSGGGGDRMYRFCEKFGLPLGLAFQIQDDLLDLTATSKVLGKSSMNDVQEGQKTVFTQYVAKDVKHRAFLERMKGKTLTREDRARLKKMFQDSGAIDHGKNMMEKYFAEAEKVVERSDLQEKDKRVFSRLIEYLRFRRV